MVVSVVDRHSVAKSAVFPVELGYFITVAVGCFSYPRVEATPVMCILAPEHDFYRGDPLKTRLVWARFGLVLISNWAGFVVETWQPFPLLLLT